MPIHDAQGGTAVRTCAAAGVGPEKYDMTRPAMIALLRYGGGFPWNRLADLQESLGIPIPFYHPVGDRSGSSSYDRTGDGGVAAKSGPRRSAAQRRYFHVGAGLAPECR